MIRRRSSPNPYPLSPDSNQIKALPVVTLTKTILLIHNEPNMGEVVEACLTDLAGWNVQVASPTLESLQKATLNAPDAIVLEFSLTDINRLLFLQELRTQPATQRIPIVLLSIRAKWLDLKALQRYQVAAVAVNPLDLAMLPIQIAKVLGWNLDSEIESEDERTGSEK
ncbi:MAG TPA: response regulator [Cyanobacteria bacterium UBA11372]|nr:response regulator [Cyanobacteria bacterium UBA11372]